jgi:transposase
MPVKAANVSKDATARICSAYVFASPPSSRVRINASTKPGFAMDARGIIPVFFCSIDAAFRQNTRTWHSAETITTNVRHCLIVRDVLAQQVIDNATALVVVHAPVRVILFEHFLAATPSRRYHTKSEDPGPPSSPATSPRRRCVTGGPGQTVQGKSVRPRIISKSPEARSENPTFSTASVIRDRAVPAASPVKCRRVATRYDKLAANYLAVIQLASIRLWLRVL